MKIYVKAASKNQIESSVDAGLAVLTELSTRYPDIFSSVPQSIDKGVVSFGRKKVPLVSIVTDNIANDRDNINISSDIRNIIMPYLQLDWGKPFQIYCATCLQTGTYEIQVYEYTT